MRGPIQVYGIRPGEDEPFAMHVLPEACGVILVLQGTFDSFSEGGMRKLFDECLNRTHGWVLVDLSKVDYLESSALGAVLYLKERSDRQGRPFAVASPRDYIRRLLEVAGLMQHLSVFDTEEEALRHLKETDVMRDS